MYRLPPSLRLICYHQLSIGILTRKYNLLPVGAIAGMPATDSEDSSSLKPLIRVDNKALPAEVCSPQAAGPTVSVVASANSKFKTIRLWREQLEIAIVDIMQGLRTTPVFVLLIFRLQAAKAGANARSHAGATRPKVLIIELLAMLICLRGHHPVSTPNQIIVVLLATGIADSRKRARPLLVSLTHPAT
jgi:hypothetical protein